MGRRVESADWSATPLGDITGWPQSLRTAAGICLASPFASCLAWGSAHTQIFNDRYLPFCHAGPHALGGRFTEGWPDSWPAIRPSFEQALAGKPAYLESQTVLLHPGAERREALLSFSFVPVPDESGSTRGVLVSVSDAAPAAELAQARKDLDALNYVISHDIRAPLRTVEEIARIVLQDQAAAIPPDAQHFLNHLAEGSAKLSQRVSALVELGRLSQHRLACRNVDVAALVAGIVEDLRKQTAPRQVALLVHELPQAEGDPELIRQVFTQVLSNAFKFTRDAAQPRIEIGGHRKDCRIEYFVADNGAGFDMKYAGRLFDLFQRMHGDAQFEGIGVGLALTRVIIGRHGGTIRAEAAKDHGATFHFSLPALRAGPSST